ncbi:choice-of-anchor G family protein, partial [Microbacterium indicum]|uniref:choice-of-anchor G family protein n=1 Tax=Microbacterium indicum TaxID=358100 RepID=UPI00056CC14F
MRALNKTTHSTGGGATLWRKRILSAGATVATAALFGAAFGAAPAVAAETDTSEAEGRLITFDGGFVDLNDVAELTPAYSATPSGVAESSSPLELSLLDALDIDLGNGLQLFGSNGILQLGALGQYATTEANSAYASAGLVGADGSIAIGSGDPAEGASLDLSPILEQAGLSALLDNARLELGAISSSATVNGSDDPTGDYRIASGQLLLTSPVVAGLSGSLVDVLGQISDPINGLVGADGVIDQTVDPLLDGITSTLNGLLLGVGSIDDLGVTATVDVDLEAAVNSVLAQPITSDDSVVTIDFSTGEVSVDLARLVADTQGGDYDGTLNGLPANTELLDPDLVQAALDGAIGSVFDQLPALLVNAVTDALNSTDVTIEIAGEINGLFGAVNIGTVDVVLSGTLGDFIGAEGSETPTVDASGTTLVGLPVGTIVTPLLTAITDTILPALVTPLSEAITDAGALDTIFRPVVEAANAVLQPVFGLVTNNLLSLTANVQETPGSFTADGSFTTDTTFSERALSLTLLPALSTPLLELSLASSTVRSSAEVVYDPTLEADGPVEAGDETTVSGEGWPPNTEVDVVLIDPTTGEPVEGAETVTVTTDEDGAFTTPYPVPAGVEPGDYEFEGTDGTHTVTTPVEVITTDDSDSSATATAASDDDSTATSDDDSTATAASDDDSTATSDDDSTATAASD